jgi:hypothetical protein
MGPVSKSVVSGIHSESIEILPFRATVPSAVVAEGPTTLSPEFTGLLDNAVKVSGYSLELYLNACSPTCHG